MIYFNGSIVRFLWIWGWILENGMRFRAHLDELSWAEDEAVETLLELVGVGGFDEDLRGKDVSEAVRTSRYFR